MTRLLEKAFAEATKLPKKDQDELARWVLAEIAAEERWDESFRRSGDQLAKLARRALNEHRKGKTRRLDPDKL